MSKALSLKLQDNIFSELETITNRLNVPRNAYINDAVSFYNDLVKRKQLKDQLSYESNLVANNSMAILEEYEVLEDDFNEN